MMDVKNVKVEGNSYVVPSVVNVVKSIYDEKNNRYDYEFASCFDIGGIIWDIVVSGILINKDNVCHLDKLTMRDKDTNEVYVDTKDVHGFMSKVCDAMGFDEKVKANMLDGVDRETCHSDTDAKEVYKVVTAMGDVIEKYKLEIGKDFCDTIYGYIKKFGIARA